MSRLCRSGICKVHGCGQVFIDGNAFRDHVRNFHSILRGKNGRTTSACPWEGCELSPTKAASFNHVISHIMKYGCRYCDAIITPRSDSMQKHFRSHHCKNIKIPASKVWSFAYAFFEKWWIVNWRTWSDPTLWSWAEWIYLDKLVYILLYYSWN